MHWAFDYIGLPWLPRINDCWAFFRRVQLERFDRAIPAIDPDNYRSMTCARLFAGHAERTHWTPVERPQEGDAVLLAHARHPSHVGVWVDVDGGGVLHCINGAGVVFQSVKALKAGGWGHLEYYRHV